MCQGGIQNRGFQHRDPGPRERAVASARDEFPFCFQQTGEFFARGGFTRDTDGARVEAGGGASGSRSRFREAAGATGLRNRMPAACERSPTEESTMPKLQRPRIRALGLLLAMAALLTLDPASRVLAQSAPDYDEQVIHSFASAMVKVEEIREEYGPKIERADSNEAAQQLQLEANTRKGIDVPTYNEIAQAMQTDGDLRTRIMTRVEELRG
jgi:hypothetical protein